MIDLPTEREPVVVVWGDCLEHMRTLPDGCVDAVITDPPYGPKTHAGARTRTLTGKGVYEEFAGSQSLVAFPSLDEATFLDVCRDCLRLAKRWVLLTCDWRHAAFAEQNMPQECIRTGVWVKPDAAPQFSGDRPGAGWEAVLLLHRPGKKRWHGGGHQAVWHCPIVKRNKLHPTQKPLKLVREWARLFTDPGETILDPFAGSGTTGVAAIAEGRRALLIEKDEHYAHIAQKRVNEAMQNTGLFAEEAKT